MDVERKRERAAEVHRKTGAKVEESRLKKVVGVGKKWDGGGGERR